MKDKWKKLLYEEKLTPEEYKQHYLGNPIIYEDGEPCSHKGCLKHVSHPCEVCGRIAANTEMTRAYYER